MGIYAKGVKGRADKLFSLVVRSRGRCQRCGSTQELQCAHILGRSRNATRTDEANAWALCRSCHLTTTHRLEEHMQLVVDTIGMDAFWELKAKAEAGVKVNDAYWLAECVRLTALLKQGDAA